MARHEAQSTPLWELMAVPEAWPLTTVLDAWAVVFFRYSFGDSAVKGGLREAEKALVSRLEELWASRPQEAERWFAEHLKLYCQRKLDGRTEEEQLAVVLWRHCSCKSQDKIHFSAAGLVAALWPCGVFVCSSTKGHARRLLAARARGQAEAKRRRLEAAVEPQGAEAAELHTAREECGELKARLAVATSELQAVREELGESREECAKLKEALATAETASLQQASELQASREEVVQCQNELQEVREENRQLQGRCERLEMQAATSPGASGDAPDLQTVLVEQAVHRDRCEQLQQHLVKAETEALARMAEIRKLCEEKGMYKGQCHQLQRQLETQAHRPQDTAGRLLDPMATAHPHGPGLAEEASASQDPGSNANVEMGYILVEDGTSSVDDDCFMADAMFLRRDEKSNYIVVQGKHLMFGNLVLAGDGKTPLKVLFAQVSRKATQVIHLQAGAATLQVTPDHLVQVPGVNGELDSDRFLKAGSLKKGDKVVLDCGKVVELASVDPYEDAHCEVLKIVFSPDLPVATFSKPPCILSLGQKASAPIRRGRQCHGGQGTCDQAADRVSMPATAPGEYGD